MFLKGDKMNRYKKFIMNGMLISPVKISAMGCDTCIPTKPKQVVVISRVGIISRPERKSDRNDETPAFRML